MHMKRVIWIFSISWAIFCLTMTGAAILQPGVFNDVAINPNAAQDQAGGIYNQGARAAYNQHLVPAGAITFIDAHNSLENLSVGYWLYPAELDGSRYGIDLSLALQHPERNTLVYIGPAETYQAALQPVQRNFHATVVKTVGNDVFAVVKHL
jgi:hypothetical protein